MQSVPPVVLTQELATALRQVEELARQGVKAIAYPCIATEPVPNAAELVHQLISETRPHVLCFTSARAVDALQQLAGRFSPTVKVAAVGNATAKRVEEVLGNKVDYIPERQTAADLAALLAKQPKRCLLHVRGDKGGHSLAEVLEPMGWRVVEVVVYRHVPIQPGPLNVADSAVVVLASGSAAQTFFAANPVPHPKWEYLAIGPTTMQWLTKNGIRARMAASPEQLLATAIGMAQGVKD